MSKQPTDDQLQQYFDGELSDGEAVAVEAALADSEAGREQLMKFSRLHHLIEAAADDVGAELDEDALFARIEEGIDQDRHRVISFEQARRRRRAITGVIMTGMAAAAAALLMWGGPADIDPVGEDDVQVIVEVAPPGSEVERVDFGSNIGTVFAVEGISGEPIAVVWINDEEGLP